MNKRHQKRYIVDGWDETNFVRLRSAIQNAEETEKIEGVVIKPLMVFLKETPDCPGVKANLHVEKVVTTRPLFWFKGRVVFRNGEPPSTFEALWQLHPGAARYIDVFPSPTGTLLEGAA